MSLGIKKGDKVVIIAGKEKGKTGKVLGIDSSKGRVIVEGLNIVKKHMRRRSEQEQGGIREVPASIHASNVALFCSSCDKGVRFGVKVSDDKSKTRVCRCCDRVL